MIKLTVLLEASAFLKVYLGVGKLIVGLRLEIHLLNRCMAVKNDYILTNTDRRLAVYCIAGIIDEVLF